MNKCDFSAKSRFKGKITPYASKASIEGDKSTHRIKPSIKTGRRICNLELLSSSPGFYGPSSRHIEGLNNTLTDIKGSLATLNIDGLKVHNMEMESSLSFSFMLSARLSMLERSVQLSADLTTSDSIIDYEAKQ